MRSVSKNLQMERNVSDTTTTISYKKCVFISEAIKHLNIHVHFFFRNTENRDAETLQNMCSMF